MTIIRVKHDKQHPYVMISKASLWDKNLSLQAVGLWTRLLARPDDWTIHIQELAESCDLHPETVNKIFNKLVNLGYAARKQLRTPSPNGKYPNRFSKFEYWIFESPKTPEEISNILSETVLSDSIKPALLSNKEEERANAPAKEEVIASFSIEEESIFSKRLSEMRRKPQFITDSYKRKVIDSVIRKKSNSPPPTDPPKNKNENLQKAKNLIIESNLFPQQFKGVLKISYGDEFLQIDCEKGTADYPFYKTDFAHFLLSPMEWDKIVNSWRNKI